ncbi:MAG: aminodeoxychorismate synthase component I [Anaerolineales bacterium]|nr:MAG: aminodeoxychorismate synthase component I [Anaerolineales bacterium]
MIEINEVLLKRNKEWLHFFRPHQVLRAESLREVRDTLREVDNLVNTNGWYAAGFVSYEAAPAFDNALHVPQGDGFPLLWFGLYPEPLAVELPTPKESPSVFSWKASIDRDGYHTAIEKIKDAIASGNTYQVNYTMRLRTDFDGDEWGFFLRLAQNQNKYASFVNTGDHVICSASPELFFELDGETITSRPMKGTAKRGRTTEEDKAQMEWLHHSAKNRAENVMIVDMIRNDLGRIATTGSVHVPELFGIEKYPTLFQMTSTVQAKTGASITEIFSALFPCASITGAPKVSTMDIISNLETTPRKIYTGSIGYIAPGRMAQFNVAIRTAFIDRVKKTAEYGVGGGIVWDSTSTDEYSEALLKARVLTEHGREFSLFETMLWTPDNGYFLLGKHIERMADSANYFDFPFSEEEMENSLKQPVHGANTPRRVKISLDCYGKFSVEVRAVQPATKSFRACLAENPVNSNDPFLFHKTTHREMYDHALVQGYDDVLLFNENDELTEFTIGNLVVEMDGELLTPPISCGLLAGTFRSHLLGANQVKEHILHADELQKCTKIYLINSVRKWVGVNISKEPTL